MAKEAIQQILAAEEEAARLVAEAKNQAKVMLDEGRGAYREGAETIIAEAKERAASLKKKYEQEARAAVAETSEQKNARVEKIRQQDAAWVDRMADRMVEEVLRYGHR